MFHTHKRTKRKKGRECGSEDNQTVPPKPCSGPLLPESGTAILVTDVNRLAKLNVNGPSLQQFYLLHGVIIYVRRRPEEVLHWYQPPDLGRCFTPSVVPVNRNKCNRHNVLLIFLSKRERFY